MAEKEVPKLLKPGEEKDKYKFFQKIGLINKPKGSVTQGLASNAADASSSIALSNGPDYQQNNLSEVGERMKTGDGFEGLDQEAYSSKKELLNANKEFLKIQEAKGIDQLKSSFSSENQVIVGSAFTDFDENNNTINKDRNFKGGKDGIIVSGIPNPNVQTSKMSTRQFDKAVGGSARFMTESPLRTDKGVKENSKTAFNRSVLEGDQSQFSIPKRYSPLVVNDFNTATFKSNKSNKIKTKDGILLDGSKSSVDNVTMVKDVLTQKDNVTGNDRFSNLGIKEVLSPTKYERKLEVRKGKKIGKGKIVAGKPTRAKVIKLKGEVDLDMSGSVDKNFEKNTKAFVGGGGRSSNIYLNRKDARRSIKGKSTKKGPIQGRSLEYTSNNKQISEEAFKKSALKNNKNINKNTAAFNTQHMNAGQPLSSLKGKNSYANNFNVNSASATGANKRSKLNKKEINSNIDMMKKKMNINISM